MNLGSGPFKMYVTRQEAKRVAKIVTKSDTGGGGEGGEGVQPIVFTPLNSSVSIFSAGKFLLLYISWDHDSVTVSNNKQVQVVIFLSEIGLLLDP